MIADSALAPGLAMRATPANVMANRAAARNLCMSQIWLIGGYLPAGGLRLGNGRSGDYLGEATAVRTTYAWLEREIDDARAADEHRGRWLVIYFDQAESVTAEIALATESPLLEAMRRLGNKGLPGDMLLEREEINV